MIQMRQYREGRKREISLELLRAFMTPDFAKALQAIFTMPDGLTKKEIEEHAGEDIHLVWAWMFIWESLGVLVFHGEVSLSLVDDFFSAPILIGWRKLRPHILEEREAMNRETIGEWFEWLADRMAERESDTPPIPAHIAHRSWVSKG